MAAKVDLYLPQTPEDTRDREEYAQLLRIYEGLRLLMTGLNNAIAEIPGPGGGSGDITNGSNIGPVGAGTAGVFAQKNGALLEFKRIVASTGVAITELADRITLTFTGLANAVGLGTGHQVFAGIIANEARFKSLLAGSGITLTNTADSITVALTPVTTPTLPEVTYGAVVPPAPIYAAIHFQSGQFAGQPDLLIMHVNEP